MSEDINRKQIKQSVPIPSFYLGRIIGKGGSNLKRIKEKYNVKIKISENYDKSYGTEWKHAYLEGKANDIDRVKKILTLQMIQFSNQKSNDRLPVSSSDVDNLSTRPRPIDTSILEQFKKKKIPVEGSVLPKSRNDTMRLIECKLVNGKMVNIFRSDTLNLEVDEATKAFYSGDTPIMYIRVDEMEYPIYKKRKDMIERDKVIEALEKSGVGKGVIKYVSEIESILISSKPIGASALPKFRNDTMREINESNLVNGKMVKIFRSDTLNLEEDEAIKAFYDGDTPIMYIRVDEIEYPIYKKRKDMIDRDDVIKALHNSSVDIGVIRHVSEIESMLMNFKQV